MISFTFLPSYSPFSFLPFSLYHGYESTYHENQYTKFKLGTCRTYYVSQYLHSYGVIVINFNTVANASVKKKWAY